MPLAVAIVATVVGFIWNFQAATNLVIIIACLYFIDYRSA